MNQLDVFSDADNYGEFEKFQKENGDTYWLASDFMKMLGYDDISIFKKSINKAMHACSSLNIPITENFIEVIDETNKGRVVDYKLTRFACYLSAMNSDIRKKQVAAAQAYFITLAEAFRTYIQEANHVERVLIRQEISEHEQSLHGVANVAGVENYAFFQNAGYRGMYNKNMNELKVYKGMSSDAIRKKRSLLDFMGKEELAANLFRITQTESKIVSQRIKGQKPLEIAAEEVGKKIRKTMHDISGHKPEDLQLTRDIREVKKGLKRTQREFKKIDSPKKKKSK